MRERVASNHQRFWEKNLLGLEIKRNQPHQTAKRLQRTLSGFFGQIFGTLICLNARLIHMPFYLSLRKKIFIRHLKILTSNKYFHLSWMILQKSPGQIFSTHKEKCSFLCAICASQTRRKISFSLNGLMIPPEALECFPIHQLPKQNSMKMNQATLKFRWFQIS